MAASPGQKIFSGKSSGKWIQFVATWDSSVIKFYVNGKRTKETTLKTPFISRIDKFYLGDDPWANQVKAAKQPELVSTANNRNAKTLIDEVYIYNRALTDREVDWAYSNIHKRKRGKDIPLSACQAITGLTLSPDIEKKQIGVNIKISKRLSKGQKTCEIAMTGPQGINDKKTLQVPVNHNQIFESLSCPSFPCGKFTIKTVLKDNKNFVLGEKTQILDSPGPPIWKNNKIGISQTPPTPYTPITEEKDGFSCLNRKIRFDNSGFINSIVSKGQQLLASPMTLSVSVDKKPVVWKGKGITKISSDANRIIWKSEAQSNIGNLVMLITAEYDGMIRYDIALNSSKQVEVDKFELEIPLRKEAATLINVPNDWHQGVFANFQERFENKNSDHDAGQKKKKNGISMASIRMGRK